VTVEVILSRFFKLTGDYLSTIENIKRNEEDQFDLPLGLCFNSKAILYVADGCRAHAFDTGNSNVFCDMFGSERADLKECHQHL